MTRPPANHSSALDLAALLRKLQKHTKTVVQENVLAKRTISKLRRKNTKLKSRLEQLQQHQQQQPVLSAENNGRESLLCRVCKEVVHPDSSCIYHSGKFVDIEGDGERELDSDSDTFGMWTCCEAEERDAIGCERGKHRFSRSSL